MVSAHSWIKHFHTTESELIFEWGRRGEARRAESGGGVLGEGLASPSPPDRGFVRAL